LIQSTDHILDEAAEHGRNVERQRRTTSDGETRRRLRRQLRRRDETPEG
jgi:hypothetical protein